MSDDVRRDNATYLFEREKSRTFFHCEGWWTGFFTILAALKARTGNPLKLPVYSVCSHNYFTRTGEDLDLGFATTANTATNVRWNKVFAPEEFRDTARMPQQDIDVSGLMPDIVVRDITTKRVVLIEVKTIGSSAKQNMQPYETIETKLRNLSWNAKLFYLVSAGHEPDSDCGLFREYKSRVLLWEDVFEAVADSPLANVFEESLAPYRRCLTSVSCPSCT